MVIVKFVRFKKGCYSQNQNANREYFRKLWVDLVLRVFGMSFVDKLDLLGG